MASSRISHPQSVEGASKLHLQRVKSITFPSKPSHAMLAQGATEYLVLLAVVLVVALIGVSLVGFVPSVSSDAKVTQSDEYWRGAARPFGILEPQFVAVDE